MRKNGRIIITKTDNLIKKSNELSLAKLNKGLTLNQMQLLAFAIFSTQQTGVTQFHKHEFEKRFDLEKYNTAAARKDSQKLLDLKMSVENLEEDYFEYWNVFQKIAYKEGAFTFKWSEDMIPHILDLKEKYITTDLAITSHFKSSFSWILYDYIKAHYGYWYIHISKEALLRLFTVENRKTYENVAAFKRTVLNMAINEINRYTEFEVKYKEYKEGRSVVAFDLIWTIGGKVEGSTKKQIQDLHRIIDIVFEDVFKYINLNDSNKREQAIHMIQQLEGMKFFLSSEVGLTKAYAGEQLKLAELYLRKLECFYVEEHNQGVTDKKVPDGVEFYNWLGKDK
jgi:plasmid replication initiation protein